MVTSCCAYNCKLRYVKGSNVIFHTFPRDEKLKAKWIAAINRINFYPAKTTKICSKHFEPSCYIYHFGQISLTKTAVPTIFNFPPHLQQSNSQVKNEIVSDSENLQFEFVDTEPEPRQPNYIVNDESPSSENDASSERLQKYEATRLTQLPVKRISTYMKRTFYVGDYNAEEFSSNPEVAEKAWKAALSLIHKKNRQLKNLTNKNKRLAMRVEKLKEIVSFYNKQNEELLSTVSTDSSSIFINRPTKPYECIFCGKQFKQESFLKNHVTNHIEGKVYQCDMCGKKFANKRSVRSHILIHMQIRPHLCELCGKSFMMPSLLRKHRDTHHHTG